MDDDGSNVQSPNDNSQTYSTMIPALGKKFDRLVFTPESCFYRNIVGGIRFDKPEDEHKMASFIKMMDQHLIADGVEHGILLLRWAKALGASLFI